ncbi:hypothetical protein Emin_0228 [Elusimicrobium minutum Pei191]|uniref:Uncharacterized protein n=1 Tax=Elusimicrobium minutum (strain Pei191) TaxID=445932 RepID=B2KB31_ELUMP|nr:hypothetical protein [Elusimicrobium minutum]ACC97790.1 hypothetical protein Emin_0228 [Elusimicrobium minutum Pei191]
MDRIKIAVPVAEVKELYTGAITALQDNRDKGPAIQPVFRDYSWCGYIMIDICVPKSLFHNSLEEHTDRCLNCLIELIRIEARESNGLEISHDAIKFAEVWYLEYGKNIVIPKRHSMHACLDKIALTLAGQHPTLSKVKYYSRVGNNGYQVGLHTKEYEICAYDKTTAAIYNGTGNDKEIFKDLLDRHNLQVLRVEVKLFKSKYIKKHLGKLKYMHSFKLFDLFNSILEQRALKHFWAAIEDALPKVKYSKVALIKQIDAAAKNDVSINDIIFKVGMDYLEHSLGRTVLKQLLVPTSAKIKGKARESQHSTLLKKRKEIQKKFKTKKFYIASRINNYLNEFKPIWIDKENDDIEGVM